MVAVYDEGWSLRGLAFFVGLGVWAIATDMSRSGCGSCALYWGVGCAEEIRNPGSID